MTRVRFVTGFLPGSFDPLTFGHLDLIRRASRMCDPIVVGIGSHHQKRPLLSLETRKQILETLVQPIATQTGVSIEVVAYTNLTVDAAHTHGARCIIRGLRVGTDFDHEISLSSINERLAPDITTVFLTGGSGVAHISSSLVKQVSELGGDVSEFVPPEVQLELERLRT